MELLRKEFPALEDSEIVKYLIGRAIAELEGREDANYMSLVENSPSYGRFRDEKDDDVNLYSEKDIKPLE